MRPVELAPGIYSIGVRDWNIRDFHGYSTYLGTTYNAFLIIDEKITLIDTVKSDFTDEMIANISRIVDPAKIDFVISNHTEMDHSGGLPHLMSVIGAEKPIYCSKMGAKNLAAHFGNDLKYVPVSDGETLNIGKRTLKFVETRMLHWPDSMFTYVVEDKILFSSDAFGQHYAGSESFDDEIGAVIMPHAKKYYANILTLFSDLIQKLLKSIGESGLEIRMICPDHGIIWRHDPGAIISAYNDWSLQKTEQKAIVLYDSMWHSTEIMADEIVSGLLASGVKAIPMHARKWHRSDIMTEMLDAKALVVGSPTLNNNIFPALMDVLTYIKGLKPANRIAAAFGSYGWSGEAANLLSTELENMKFKVVEPPLRVKYIPDTASKDLCFEFGKKIGEHIKTA